MMSSNTTLIFMDARPKTSFRTPKSTGDVSAQLLRGPRHDWLQQRGSDRRVCAEQCDVYHITSQHVDYQCISTRTAARALSLCASPPLLPSLCCSALLYAFCFCVLPARCCFRLGGALSSSGAGVSSMWRFACECLWPALRAAGGAGPPPCRRPRLRAGVRPRPSHTGRCQLPASRAGRRGLWSDCPCALGSVPRAPFFKCLEIARCFTVPRRCARQTALLPHETVRTLPALTSSLPRCPPLPCLRSRRAPVQAPLAGAKEAYARASCSLVLNGLALASSSASVPLLCSVPALVAIS